MAVSGVSATTPVQQPQTPAPKNPAGMDGIGEDAFMQLLLAQLKNQDPLKPMDDTEFISQMAQFNSLNELMSINKVLGELMTAQTVAQGSALIGKTITAHISADDSTLTGKVTGLQISNDKVTLTVDGKQIPMDAVRSVTETPPTEGGSAIW